MMLRRFLSFFAQTNLFFYAVLWLIFLLVMGTIAQKDMGLYLAQERYFSSFILWIAGIIPTPGGYSIMAFITLGLFAKLLLQRWSMAKLGTIVTHLGVLLLLVGGFITAIFSHEGNMVITENQSSNYFSDYHQRELVIAADGDDIIINQDDLENKNITKKLPFPLKIISYYPNIQLIKRDEIIDDGKYKGMAQAIKMQNAPTMLNNEENNVGLIFEINNSNDEDNINGTYSIFENMPVTQHLTIGTKKYSLTIRKKRTYLPFSIKLIDFKKTVHPNTNLAKTYSSDVILQDGVNKDLQWRSLIEMNSPLRYKGYTFYQSSFIVAGEVEKTVLTVVKNIGRIFPYISSIIICLGILIHLIQRRRKHR